MGVITADNMNNFISTKNLFSKIKREWKSFGAANLLDENDFYEHVDWVLRELGISAFKEEEAILIVKNNKALLPEDFSLLYSAYKCCLEDGDVMDAHLQNKTVLYNDITCDIISKRSGCELECCGGEQILQRITTRQYLKEGCLTRSYSVKHLLKLSPNVKPLCVDSCLNLFQTSEDEITINNREILTNFCNGDIYIKYYAFPTDEDGLPMLPNIHKVIKAVEWYIKWQILLNLWITDDLKDSQNKWAKAEQEYNKALAEARFELKMPTFNYLLNQVRINRGVNKLAYFSQLDRKRF